MDKEVINAVSALAGINDCQKEINDNLNKVRENSKEHRRVIEDTMANNEEIDELLKMMAWK